MKDQIGLHGRRCHQHQLHRSHAPSQTSHQKIPPVFVVPYGCRLLLSFVSLCFFKKMIFGTDCLPKVVQMTAYKSYITLVQFGQYFHLVFECIISFPGEGIQRCVSAVLSYGSHVIVQAGECRLQILVVCTKVNTEQCNPVCLLACKYTGPETLFSTQEMPVEKQIRRNLQLIQFSPNERLKWPSAQFMQGTEDFMEKPRCTQETTWLFLAFS